jgi:nickel superoxide dismutase
MAKLDPERPFKNRREKMNKKCFQTALVFLMIFFTAAYAAAHCEIPCGIYDDEMRVRMIAEHITTIEKSMNQIVRLRGQKAGDDNQRVRWVMNKEDHANELQHIVSQYFMTQRIKLDTKNYAQKLGVLHKMLVYAMKCKQTTDFSHITMLRSLLKEFQGLYFDHSHK